MRDRPVSMNLIAVLLLFVAFFTLSGRAARAQDRVTYTPEGASKPITALGVILDFTGDELTIRVGLGTQHVPSQRIVKIETQYLPEHMRGQELLRNGNTVEALASLRDALKRETRTWVDREILALIVQAELRQMDLAGAVRDFQMIVASDPATRHWGIAPLIWSPTLIPDTLRGEMQTLINKTGPGDQLLAASILLLDPVHGGLAERKLNELSRNTNPLISGYSKAQLWRLELDSRKISDVTLERWRDHISRLPKELRPGPQFLLSRGYEILGELRAAATEALWIPFVYPENEVLSARALLDAAANLERSGLLIESQNLYRELLIRYPWSKDAGQARSRLEEHSGKS
ncbi:hypothetical protein [Planctomicrobium sp. SH527]|uniref:hypothetical protein n=1 Tax=Planctomicrobium sp. SH527 TaxID=3448123 RepID=UPI003F5C91A8